MMQDLGPWVVPTKRRPLLPGGLLHELPVELLICVLAQLDAVDLLRLRMCRVRDSKTRREILSEHLLEEVSELAIATRHRPERAPPAPGYPNIRRLYELDILERPLCFTHSRDTIDLLASWGETGGPVDEARVNRSEAFGTAICGAAPMRAGYHHADFVAGQDGVQWWQTWCRIGVCRRTYNPELEPECMSNSQYGWAWADRWGNACHNRQYTPENTRWEEQESWTEGDVLSLRLDLRTGIDEYGILTAYKVRACLCFCTSA